MNSKQLMHDIKRLAALMIILLIGFKILFYKESFGIVFVWVASLFFLVIIPGFLLANLLLKDTEDFEKIIFGIMFMAGLASVLAYYVGIMSGNLYYYYIIGVLGLIVLVYFNYFTKTSKEK